MAENAIPSQTPETYRKLRSVSNTLGGLVASVGILVLIGWVFNITVLTSIRTDTVPMNPVTAIGFIIAGVSVVLIQESRHQQYKRPVKILSEILILIGFLKLVSILTGLEIPFDQLLFRDRLWNPHRLAYDSIAPNTAINFILAGLAIFHIDHETGKHRRPSQFIAIVITLFALLSLYGYLYGIETLYSVKTFIPMAIHTAFCFLLLGASILFARPDKGSMSIVIGESSGQIIFMRFVAFLLPLVYGWLKIQGENAGVFSKEFGTALFAILTYAVSMFFLARQSVLTYKIRETRRKAMEVIKENERRLQSILDQSAAHVSLKTLLGKYTLVNKQFEKDFKREQADVIGKTDYDLFPRELAIELNKYDHQIIKTGKPKNFEEKYLQEDGIHTYLTVKFPLFNNNARIYALGAVSTDITQRKKLEEELRQSEERYALAMQGTNDGLWDWDISTGYLFMSARLKSMLGFKEDELPNTIEAWENHLHPEDREKALNVIQEYFDKKIPEYVNEFRMIKKDGSLIWMLSRGMALWDEQGKLYRMIGYQTDLTERKRLEEELRKSHQRLFGILDNLGEGVIVADADGNLIIFNRRAEEIMGSGSASGSWKEWNQKFEFLHKDGLTPFQKTEMPLYLAIKGDASNNVEMLIRNEDLPDGKWLAVSGRPVKNELRQVIAGVIVFRDITMRKQLEGLFSENDTRLKMILASIGEGIIILDKEEKPLMLNQKALEILGKEPTSIPVSDWPQHFGIYSPDGETLFPGSLFPLTLALKGIESKGQEVLIRNSRLPEGRHVFLSARPITNNLNELTGAILDFRDVTQQRKLEEYLQEIETKFRTLVKNQKPEP